MCIVFTNSNSNYDDVIGNVGVVVWATTSDTILCVFNQDCVRIIIENQFLTKNKNNYRELRIRIIIIEN